MGRGRTGQGLGRAVHRLRRQLRRDVARLGQWGRPRGRPAGPGPVWCRSRAWLAERRITVVSTVPSLASLWDERHLAGVRLLVLGGEACPPQLGWRLAAGREVWNTYGPTEATVVSTVAPILAERPITIGYPLRGWEVALVDEDGRPAAGGEPGEIVIAGVGLGRYLDPSLDTTRYSPLAALGWERAYRTGDMARETADGLEYFGPARQPGEDRGPAHRARRDRGSVGSGAAVASSCCRRAQDSGRQPGASRLRRGRGRWCRAPGAARRPATSSSSTTHRWPGSATAQALGQGRQGCSPVAATRCRSAPGRPRRRKKMEHAGVAGPGPAVSLGPLAGTSLWLAERWEDQLGPVPICADSDFFELGGTSLAAARLVSVLRGRFPTLAVADVYAHRRLGELAYHLDHLACSTNTAQPVATGSRRWGTVQLGGALVITAIGALQWVLAVFAYNQWQGASAGPRIGWLSVLAGWLLVSSAPGRGAMVAMARRLLLARLRPGRYPRRSWLACRLWFVERLADVLNVDQLAGTPWAARYARLFGAEVGEGARLATLPSPSALARIGAGATIEAEVDLRGWWVEDSDLVVGEVSVGPGARVGTRCALMPGADVGAWAEVEPGSVITGEVPAGERWSGSPARRVGRAGDDWPATAPGPGTRRRARVTKIRFALGLGLLSLLPLAAAGPEVVILWGLNGHLGSLPASFGSVAAEAPLLVASYIATYALVAGLLVRALGRLVRPGWYRDDGVLAYALWLSGSIMARTRGLLFPLYAALITRPWLRLMGVRVGKRTEVSVAVGLSALTSLGDASFVTDDVVFSNVRARDGWLRVTPIEVGSRTFLGNGAILRPGTVLGDECLVGVLSSPPTSSANGTSWLGLPALELPRVPERPDPVPHGQPARGTSSWRGPRWSWSGCLFPGPCRCCSACSSSTPSNASVLPRGPGPCWRRRPPCLSPLVPERLRSLSRSNGP